MTEKNPSEEKEDQTKKPVDEAQQQPAPNPEETENLTGSNVNSEPGSGSGG